MKAIKIPAKLCEAMSGKIAPVLLLLLLHGVIMAHSIRNKTATVDELGHLTAGLYALNHNDFRCNRLSPPLQNMLCALPVYLFGDYKLTYDHSCWKEGVWNGLGDRFVEANPATFHKNLTLGRYGSMALSILLCLLIFIWSRDIWGYWPALGVLTLAVFEPNFIAHGRLTTADAAPTLFFLLSGYLAWRFVKKPSWQRLIAVGVAFGLTWSSKHSGPVMIIALFFGFSLLFQRHSQPLGFRWIPGLKKKSGLRRSLWLSAMLSAIILFVGLLVIWAVYGFEVGDSIEGKREPKRSLLWMQTQLPIQTATYILGLEERYPFDQTNTDDPYWRLISGWLPAYSHWEGFCANRLNAQRGSPAFFLGETSYRKKDMYYPFLFLTKTPLPLLIILFIGIIALALRLARPGRRALILGLIIPVVYAAILIGCNRAYIGYRHALPVVPFLLVVMGGAAFKTLLPSSLRKDNRRLDNNTLIGIALSCGLAVWLFVDVLAVHPNYLTYYNSLIGGPSNGHYYAVDSNLDWGQDLLELKDYLAEHNINDAYLLYFGPKTLPEAYGVPHRKYKQQKTLQPGTYVISVTMLRQYIASYFMPELISFSNRQPDDVIADTMFVFYVK